MIDLWRMGERKMQEAKVFTKNNIFQKFEVLKTNRNKRYRYHEFFVEGVRSLNEAVRNNWKIKSFVYDKNNLSDWAKDMINKVNTDMNYCLTPELMKELSGKEDTSELMAVIEMREDELEQVTLSEKPFIVLFDRPSNRGNLGTMIRSCDALGVDMLIITGHAVDLYDTDVVVSAMGSFFKLPVIRISDNKALFEYIDKLKKRYTDFTTIGTTAHNEDPVYSINLTSPLMLMMGNETMGLNKTLKEYCDLLCTIPMSENSYATSFNVSCAASILMYEITRQRGIKIKGTL
ncbi:23S rRNA (uridine(2479)-2'-O)-methyltransferase [Lachnospiraceae bacterium]|uniref:RNA methyltransferase n=2 Tax=Lachnospiraceae TaxID=186803 RepID=A0A9D2PQA7_9FIRM|nr:MULTISPECIES: TrmH family RNA methyltransferase [Lachnospiraceae]GFI46650.1 23S rRNA (uridine(2479)-2'-O)-methyltransferase [Lachnospiraceae bacterium]HJC63857.1 RNA methyltransferase [Candidatus Blautia merdavium]